MIPLGLGPAIRPGTQAPNQQPIVIGTSISNPTNTTINNTTNSTTGQPVPIVITFDAVGGSGNLLADVAIAGVDIGPSTMDASLPVTLAVDQDIAIRASGQQPMAQSVAVTLAIDQPPLPISFPAQVLPPNAAQESGGNLAASAASLAYLSQIADTMRLLIAEVRTHNLQLAILTGVNIDSALGDEQVTFN